MAKYFRRPWPATLALVLCLGAVQAANAQGAVPDPDDDRPNVPPLMRERVHPSELRDFGEGHHSPLDDEECKHGYMRLWSPQLIRRPMSPWAGLFEGRASAEFDLGAGRSGRPIHVAPTLAYGVDRDWGIVIDTRRGACVDGGGARCERRFDQVSFDAIFVIDSRWAFEWIAKAGLASGPFDPFTLSLRAGAAAKALFDGFALQLDLLAQTPMNRAYLDPTMIVVPAQLQIRLASHLAAYFTVGFRGAFVSGHTDLTMPVGAGLLLGWSAFDVVAEWRFPRVVGTNRTWDERSLFVTVVVRGW